NPQVDITDNLLQAIGLIRKARRENTMVYDLVNQPDLMTGEAPSVATENVLRMFYSGQYLTRAVGKDKLAQALSDYVTGAMATTPDAGLFGEVVTPDQILATIEPITEGQGDAETQPQEARGQPADGGNTGIGDDQTQQADGRQGAGDGGAEVVADRQGQPGQDADAQAQQQAGQGDPATQESDGAPAGRADAGQQGDSGRRAAPARGRARKAKSEGVKPKKAKPAEAASEQPAIDREKLDKNFRTFPTLILNNLLERGEAAKLYKA
ncbi:hypothetical protein RZS08_09330, partial [Arthrospira platensis SPKY1]|nr:hypothetical protein [Arthrospira platensis SPKY1]